MIFLHPGGGKRGRRLGLPPAASLFSWPHLPCPRGQAGPVIFQKVVQLMEKLVVEEEGLGGRGVFCRMLPRSALGRPWGPGGWPFAASRGLRAALGGCCYGRGCCNFRGPGDPQRRCKPAPSGRAPAPPCKGETHLYARGERPGGDKSGLGQTEPLRPGPRGAATPSTPAASAGDAGGDLGPSEVAGVARAPGPARLAPSLGAWHLAGARRRRTDEWVGPTAGWAGVRRGGRGCMGCGMFCARALARSSWLSGTACKGFGREPWAKALCDLQKRTFDNPYEFAATQKPLLSPC